MPSPADRLLRSIYRRPASWLFEQYGLRPPSASQVAAFAARELGTVCAVDTGFADDLDAVVVVGGGCLGSCAARPADLGLDCVADILAPLTFASVTGSACLIYLPIGEELLTAGDIRAEQWRRFGGVVNRFVRGLAGQLPAPTNLTVCQTDNAAESRKLEETVRARRGQLDACDLGNLYELRPSRNPSPPSPGRLAQYRRTIVSYLPEVAASLADGCSGRVVVVENIHQVRAVNTARHLLDGNTDGGRIDHIVTLPSPTLSGTGRLSRAQGPDALRVLDDPELTARRILAAPDVVLAYWEAALKPLATGRSLVEVLAAIRDLLYTAVAGPGPASSNHVNGEADALAA
ncbi:hypothetical protein R8Z50_22415 [Longispora sp. K20-0274]|uniref:hypothetical protein n=1 Tax=Longispora sp. K20-0274 TaxID=3088255 RepID=UPI00399A2B88